MAGKLKKQEKTETLTFEVFELDLDEDDRQRLADNPRGFFTDLLKEEGQTVNDLLVAADEVFKKEIPGGGPSLPPTVWHCTAPPHRKSSWMTVVPHLTEEEPPIR
jgi:hypothetical protein